MARRQQRRTGVKAILNTRKVQKALALRVKGYTLAMIARECGYHTVEAVHKAIKTALAKSLHESADDLRILETQRLDAVLTAIWARATHESSPEADTRYQVMRRLIQEVGATCVDPAQQTGLADLLDWVDTLWERATGGQVEAVDRVLKIMQRRAALWGLDMPFKHAPTTPDGAQPYAPEPPAPSDAFFLDLATMFRELGPQHVNGSAAAARAEPDDL